MITETKQVTPERTLLTSLRKDWIIDAQIERILEICETRYLSPLRVIDMMINGHGFLPFKGQMYEISLMTEITSSGTRYTRVFEVKFRSLHGKHFALVKHIGVNRV